MPRRRGETLVDLRHLLEDLRDAYPGALHFHHLDPSAKAFAVSRQGVTRALSAAREEARKCVLLCADCHAMVEAGLLSMPQMTMSQQHDCSSGRG